MSTPPASRNTVSSATFCLLPYLLPPAFYLVTRLQLLLNPRPGVLQLDRPVEHGMLRRAVGIDAEVADPLELETCADGCRGGARLHLRIADHLERSGIQRGAIIVEPAGI